MSLYAVIGTRVVVDHWTVEAADHNHAMEIASHTAPHNTHSRDYTMETFYIPLGDG